MMLFILDVVVSTILIIYELPKMRFSAYVLVLHIVKFALVVVVILDKVVVGDDLERHGFFTRQKSKCDMSRGSWVRDDSYPLYDSFQCSFIYEKFNCQKNDRRDKSYLNYRWQPSSCEIPKFNGRDLLKRMRGKKIMFVGDILSMNQWQSLVCMTHTSDLREFLLTHNDGVSNFEFPSMKVSMLFDHTREFLVDIVKDPEKGRVLKLDSMMRGELWKKQDVLIFNMWRAWLHIPMGQKWDHIQVGKKTLKSMDRLVAIEKMLRTWAKWVDKNIDLSKTKVFFVGPVPNHRHGYEWGNPSAKSCAKETEPVPGSKYPWTERESLEKMVRRRLKWILKKQIELLDVTLLSQLRKDGHPSVYGSRYHTKMDCDRWCLPGVPDTWNELLYAAISQN